MAYVLIVDGVVVQKQPYLQAGFVEAPDDVVCGMLHAGGEYSNPPPVVSVPQSVTRFQAQAALYLAGLLDDVEALMSDPSTPALAKIAWANALEFKRTSPTIAAMSAVLGMTDAQIDQLFITAATLDA